MGFLRSERIMTLTEEQRKRMNTYIKALMSLDKTTDKKFIPATAEDVKKSGLYTAPRNLNFDVAFTFLSIKRERSTIRESKKNPGDKIEVIEI
jgi:hypothetical protein